MSRAPKEAGSDALLPVTQADGLVALLDDAATKLGNFLMTKTDLSVDSVVESEALIRGIDHSSYSASTDRLIVALRNLAGNAGALAAFEPEIRDIAGNTNWQCLVDAIAQADAALSEVSAS